jgi:hypothetical protein
MPGDFLSPAASLRDVTPEGEPSVHVYAEPAHYRLLRWLIILRGWFVCLLYLTPRAEPAKDRRSLPKGMGRARLGTLCTCLLRMPAILSSRTKFKRPLNAEAEQPHSRSILPPPFVGSTLLCLLNTSERGDY